MTKAHVIYMGCAPMQARSLTVPQMDSLPIFPPGKKAGETIKPSVDMAILPAGIWSTAASSGVKKGIFKMGFEYFFDQFRCLFSAGTVGECNCFLHICVLSDEVHDQVNELLNNNTYYTKAIHAFSANICRNINS